MRSRQMHTRVCLRERVRELPFVAGLEAKQVEAFCSAFVDGRNLFVTGAGGCGKSHVIELLRRALSAVRGEGAVLAPTKVAAARCAATRSRSQPCASNALSPRFAEQDRRSDAPPLRRLPSAIPQPGRHREAAHTPAVGQRRRRRGRGRAGTGCGLALRLLCVSALPHTRPPAGKVFVPVESHFVRARVASVSVVIVDEVRHPHFRVLSPLVYTLPPPQVSMMSSFHFESLLMLVRSCKSSRVHSGSSAAILRNFRPFWFATRCARVCLSPAKRAAA